MTSTKSRSKPIIYPDYCHNLSPTVRKWCPLWAADVQAMQDVGLFSDGRPLLHLGNHPVKWVRLTGLVVAVDTWENSMQAKRVITLDDSSGACIECSAVMPVRDKVIDKCHFGDKESRVKENEMPREQQALISGTSSVQTPSVPWDEVHVGSVVKIKGRVAIWWDEKRLEIVKIEVLRCTDQEVRCWNEVLDFRRKTLDKPWRLTREEEHKCRKRQERQKAYKERMAQLTANFRSH